MGAGAYSEQELVEGAVEEILAALGWSTQSAAGETFGAKGTFGRASAREVVLGGACGRPWRG